MIKTVEAVVDEHGNVRLLEPVQVPAARRAFVMILDEEPGADLTERIDHPEEVDPILENLNRVYGKNPEISRLPKDIAAAQFKTLKRHGQ